MNEEFLFDIARIKQSCVLRRDDHKRAEDNKRAGKYILCIQAIEDVEMDVKKEISKTKKPKART